MNRKTFDVEAIMTPAAWKACSCPVHGCVLYRASCGWICPRGTDCTGLVGDRLLIERVTARMSKLDRETISEKHERALLKLIERVAIEQHQRS